MTSPSKSSEQDTVGQASPRTLVEALLSAPTLEHPRCLRLELGTVCGRQWPTVRPEQCPWLLWSRLRPNTLLALAPDTGDAPPRIGFSQGFHSLPSLYLSATSFTFCISFFLPLFFEFMLSAFSRCSGVCGPPLLGLFFHNTTNSTNLSLMDRQFSR